MNLVKSAVALVVVLSATVSVAQVNRGQIDGKQNTITTAVPFLMITPDARTGAMGDAGVALPNDVNAIHWNAAKLAFMDRKGSINMSYTPWLELWYPMFHSDMCLLTTNLVHVMLLEDPYVTSH